MKIQRYNNQSIELQIIKCNKYTNKSFIDINNQFNRMNQPL
jgi:hypothetical protein